MVDKLQEGLATMYCLIKTHLCERSSSPWHIIPPIEDFVNINRRIAVYSAINNRVGKIKFTSHTTVRAVRHTAVQFKIKYVLALGSNAKD